MTTPHHLKYTNTHEWLNPTELAMPMGITYHAQGLLGDIVFIELPEVGQQVHAGQAIGVLESVKAASDYYAPISGEIVAINEALKDQPELINQAPYTQAWICQIAPSNPHDAKNLLDASAYQLEIHEGA
ncbi:MAG: glycine cleavage system protein GcvH [Gammaproteobacteria bacterium]|nr:glycine cleavage system protein GcvH [Gammaproteobacteria bacterium]